MTFPASGGKTEAGQGRLRFFICGRDVDIHLVRSSRRRTLQLRVGAHGVEARAPSWMSDDEITRFLHQKQAWIEKAVEQTRQQAGIPPDVFSSGGGIYVLGQKYHLQVVVFNGQKNFLEEFPQGWRVGGDPSAVRRLLVKWHRLKAQKVFDGLVGSWAQRIGVSCPVVAIRQQRRLWGSYSARTGRVNLNWRMLAFPCEVIEYIVIHELCHARHLNHSRSFWEEVSRFCPDWRERRLWLRTRARRYLFL